MKPSTERISAICDTVNAHLDQYRQCRMIHKREGKSWPQAVRDARMEIYDRYKEDACSESLFF